jgi:predicted transcriptional regulator
VDDLYVASCLNYGLVVAIDVSGYGNDILDNITTLDSGTFGVLLSGGIVSWQHPTLRHFDVRGSYIGGIYLDNVKDAVLEDSRCLNPDVFKGEFYVVDSQLDIYRTEHTFASATSQGGAEERATSWRYVDLTYTWQNGMPIPDYPYMVLDYMDTPIYSGTTDAAGWLGNVTVWEWNLDMYGLQVRSSIRPMLSAPPAGLFGPTINIDRDINTTVVFTDDMLPDLSVTHPPADLLQNTTSIIVNGSATDELSGLRAVMVAFESSSGDRSGWHTWNGSGPWEVDLEGLSEGGNRVIVRAYDLANYPDGAFAEVTRSVTVDTVRPWMRVVRPVPTGVTPFVTNESHMPYELEFASDVVTVVVNGEPHAVTLLGRFSGTLDLAVGYNVLAWTVVDIAGNQNTTTVVWVLDLTPPTLSVSLPTGVLYTNAPRLAISGKTDPDGTSVLVNGADAMVTGGDWTFTLDLLEGRSDILIEAVDGAGNRVRLSRTVVLDTVAPVIEILEPLDGSATNRVPITVRGTVDSPLLDEVVTVNGEQVSVVGGEFTVTLPAPFDGSLVISVVGLDIAGNEGRAVATVVVDRVPPSVTGLSVADGQLTNDPHLLLEGDVEAGAVLHIDAELVDYVGSSFAFELDLAEGANSVSIEAVDAVGNRWNQNITVRLDTVAPQLVLDGFLDGRIAFHGDGLTLTGRTEPGAAVLVIVGNLTTPVTVDATGEFSLEMALPLAETPIQVLAQDPAGNGRTEGLVAMRTVLAPAPKWTESPIVWGGSAFGAVLTVLIVAAVLEPSRYALLLLILPLYARLHKHEVLDNKTRYALHGLILENPGLHYNEIIREFGLTNGVAAYHLHVLEREGFLRAVRDGTLKRFYSVTTKVPQDRRLTPDQIRDEIVRFVAKTPGINQREIVSELGIGRTVAGYHLKAMVDDGILESSRFGKFTTYKVKPGRRLL